jgi:peptide/nickel transport system permease protein
MADGFQRVRTAPWAVIWTCLALGITTLGCTLLGERLRDLFDPKLRGAGK